MKHSTYSCTILKSLQPLLKQVIRRSIMKPAQSFPAIAPATSAAAPNLGSGASALFNPIGTVPSFSSTSRLSTRSAGSGSRPRRPKPIVMGATPPPPSMQPAQQPTTAFESSHQQQQGGDRCDFKVIQQTCALFGLDLVSVVSNLRLVFNGVVCILPVSAQC